MQNVDGGFGGGHGQLSHCASSYAAVLSLVMVGGEEALNVIDRKMLLVKASAAVYTTLLINWLNYSWKWLGDLKQPDGSFQVCVGGEQDVR